MAYLSLYRKWRPRRFEEVVGQKHITRTLSNAIRLGRISHAYLFCGPRGTGKTTVARLLAKALNCKEGPTPTPCDECENCQRIQAGHSLDVVEIDGASNRGIDEVRDLRERVKLSPAESRYKVYIIDEVHMLTPEAFNALLKTLEEPPSHVVFVLATTEPHKVLPTILSRCQRFDFRRLAFSEVAKRLGEVACAEGVEAEDAALYLLAKKGEGSLRDSLGLLEQCMTFSEGALTYEKAVSVLGVSLADSLFDFARMVALRDLAGTFQFISEMISSGRDPEQFLKDLAEHYRNLLVIKECQGGTDLVEASESQKEILKEQAELYDAQELLRILGLVLSAEGEMRRSSQPQIVLEFLAVKLMRPEASGDLASLARRVEELERRVVSGSLLAATGQEAGMVQATGAVKVASGTEAPQGEPAAPAEATGERSVEVEAVGTWWPRLLEEVKRTRKSVHAFLVEGKPLRVSDNAVIVGFGKDWGFHMEMLSQEVNRKVVESTIRDLLGRPLRLKCELIEEEPREETEQARDSGPNADLPTDAEPGEEGRDESLKEGPFVEDSALEEAQPDDETALGPQVEVGELLERKRRIEAEPVIKDVVSMFGGRILKIG